MPKNEDYAIGSIESERNPSSHVVDELRKSFKPPGAGAPTTPAEKIEEALAQVQNSVREQQMSTESNLQNCLAKASTHVADSQAVDTIFAITQQLSALISQGNESLRANIPQVNEMVANLGAQLAMQQAKSDRQVSMALQQAVAAMSDAQSAMFQSMSIAEMQQLVRGAGQIVKDVIAPGQVQ